MCITNHLIYNNLQSGVIALHGGITYIPLPVKAGINILAQKNICSFISIHVAFCSRGNAVKLLRHLRILTGYNITHGDGAMFGMLSSQPTDTSNHEYSHTRSRIETTLKTDNSLWCLVSKKVSK